MPSAEGEDIGSLYLDDGYLGFSTDVEEKSIINDTINYVIKVVEGDQYTIRNVNISGNDKTHEHVIRREFEPYRGISSAEPISCVRNVRLLILVSLMQKK